MDSKDEVLIQNARFYEAFEQQNLSLIGGIWSHESYVKCVHPGWTALVGWENVRESWERIFSSETRMKFSLRNIRADVFGTLALVVLEEEICFTSGPATRTQSIMATNIFEFDGSTWRMIHHHGSPVVNANPSGGEEDTYRFRYN